MIGAFRSSHCFNVQVSKCFLGGPLLYRSLVVVYFDPWHPWFRNISTIPVDVIREKFYVNSNKPDCVPDRTVAGLVVVFKNGGGLGTGESYMPGVNLSSFSFERRHGKGQIFI